MRNFFLPQIGRTSNKNAKAQSMSFIQIPSQKKRCQNLLDPYKETQDFQHCPSIARQCSRFCFCPGKKSVTQNCTSVTVLSKLNISINSQPIDFKFCMVPNLTKLNEPKYEKPNQTNPNQIKPFPFKC